MWSRSNHLVASAIATQDIDSRDWMHPDTARTLTRRLADTIGATKPDADSLAEALDDDVWLDFVADTLVSDFDVADRRQLWVEGVAELHTETVVFGGHRTHAAPQRITRRLPLHLLQEREHILHMVFSHVVFDGWSTVSR